MKKKLFIVLVILCLISIFINIRLAVNYNNAKKVFLSNTYNSLVNISKLLDNLTTSVTKDNARIDYNLSYLKKENIELDWSIHGLSALSPNNRASHKFEDFNEMRSRAIMANSDNTDKQVNDIAQYNEIIQDLISELSPNGELNVDEYGDLTRTPNYSLSIKQIIDSVNDTLAKP